jgi:hypothetical protein
METAEVWEERAAVVYRRLVIWAMVGTARERAL